MIREVIKIRVACVPLPFELFARTHCFLILAVVRNDNLVDLKDDTGSRQLGGRHRLQIMRLGAANRDYGLELWRSTCQIITKPKIMVGIKYRTNEGV
jgi:hypothetical protein